MYCTVSRGAHGNGYSLGGYNSDDGYDHRQQQYTSLSEQYHAQPDLFIPGSDNFRSYTAGLQVRKTVNIFSEEAGQQLHCGRCIYAIALCPPHPCTILIAFSLFPFLSNKSEMDFSKLIVVLGLATLSHFCSKKSDTAFSKWSVVMCLATVFYLSIKCRDGFRAQETKAACSSVANLHGCIWTSDQLDL